MFSGIVSSARNTLSPSQALELARTYLENARKATDIKITLVLCHDTEVSLSQAKKAAKRTKDNTVRDGIASTYTDLGVFLHSFDFQDEAQASFEKARKLGAPAHNQGLIVKQSPRSRSRADSTKRDSTFSHDALVANPLDLLLLSASLQSSQDNSKNAVDMVFQSNTVTQGAPTVTPPSHTVTVSTPDDVTTASPKDTNFQPNASPADPPTNTPAVAVTSKDNGTALEGDIATIPLNIFVGNVRPPALLFKPPEADERLHDTLQLACCLGLLQTSASLDDIVDPTVQTWLQFTKDNPDEQERLRTMTKNVIRAFKRDELKDSKAITEVVYLAPVLEKDDFQHLLREFYVGIDHSGLLDIYQLEGLAQLLQGADAGYIEVDDLVKILQLLSSRLQNTHRQSQTQVYKLTLAVSHVLDAMADADVKDLDRVTLHEPLSSFLENLKKSSDSYLVYQAAYASQALLYVPDNESLTNAVLRRTGKVVQGVSCLVSAVKGLDLNGFIGGLKSIQDGLAGVSQVAQVVQNAYCGAKSLAEGGQGFLEGLKAGLSFNRKCAWYPALRGIDTLIRDGQFAKFKKLVCEAPCRRDQAFQWGVCQRLRDIAANSMWDIDTRQSAIAFLGEIYQNDAEWGRHAAVKQWILSILMQLSSTPLDDMHSHNILTAVSAMLRELGKNGDQEKQALYRACREEGPGSYPWKVVLPAIGSPSLLDRVQERLDVEGTLRQLRKQRLNQRGNAVFIPPQAKSNIQAPDGERFPLMEAVHNGLSDDRKVILILGDSGSGKSTFSRELECEMWRKYEKNGSIPLHINLPAIDRPEHDMVAKQLRKAEFTEPQIRELKQYRRFVLICDGYDESQQTRNLYTSNRLNEPGEWNARMIISCRSEYLGVDYRDRFQPGDRNHRSSQAQFQEAVITPFSLDQVQDYINQYVSVHQPLWGAKEYKDALELIPSMKELIKNPFLMSLSLEVLPRMVDPGQGFSATHITRVALYDHFIEHWFERGKKRLGEKNLSPQARAAFENLIDEGFTPSGIDFLKKLSIAIYKEQDGQPIVQYSRYKDDGSWKTAFFSREDEKQLLREACPLIRSGNQHRFIHRSLLEYGVALAIYDPQDWKGTTPPNQLLVRPDNKKPSTLTMPEALKGSHDGSGPSLDLRSPLAWRSFVNDYSTLQFLEERVHQEPVFRKLLLDYIEHSKTDEKWCTAAANAITILVRAGVRFLRADLQGIKISGADLSYGMFESAQLQGADLTNVNLRGVWLPSANLDNAQMSGVQFGELPYLEHDSDILSMVFSPDGKTFSVGLGDGNINVYSTSNWEKQWTLSNNNSKVESGNGNEEESEDEGEHEDEKDVQHDDRKENQQDEDKDSGDVNEYRAMILVYSPDGRFIASSFNSEHAVHLWDLETGDRTRIMSGHEDTVNCVAFIPQSNRIASTSDDLTVRLWNADVEDCINTLTGHTGFVLHVSCSPEGKQLASCSWDTTVRLWDAQAGACSHILSGHDDAVRCVVYSPQGCLVASASDDKTVRLWDTGTGQCLHSFTEHTMGVNSVTFSPKGDMMACTAKDNTVWLWDIEIGLCRHMFSSVSLMNPHDNISSRDPLIACCGEDMTVRLWDIETGVCRQTLSGHKGYVEHVMFSPGGDLIVFCDEDNTVRLWEVEATTHLHVPPNHRGRITGLSVSPTGGQASSCSADGDVRLWDLETGTCRRTLTDHSSEIYCLAYAPQGSQLASASNDKTVRIWDPETGVCLKTLTGHTAAVLEVVYSPDGYQLMSGSCDNTARLWNISTGDCSLVLGGHEDWVNSITYSLQGDKAASGCDDKTARLWDIQTGTCLHVLVDHDGGIGSVAFSPKGEQIVTSSDDLTARLWSVETGECLRVLIGHTDMIKPAIFSPKGDRIATASYDGTVRLWDAQTGVCIHSLEDHSDYVSNIAFSPKGDLIASSGGDKTVRLWDPTSGQCRAVIRAFQPVLIMTWTSDTKYLVGGCMDGSVGTWEVTYDEDRCGVDVRWRATAGALVVEDASVQNARGMGPSKRRLLKQRGAIGEPVHPLREAGKKFIRMASVVSKLKSASSKSASADVKQPEQKKVKEQPRERRHTM